MSPPPVTARPPGADLWRSLRRAPVARVAATVALLLVLAAVFGPLLSPYDPFNPATLNLLDGFTPPLQSGLSGSYFPLGSDAQGRDMLTTILIGSRLSLLVALAATAFSLLVGVSLGLAAGYLGGALDTVIMRLADIQLTFPGILIALLVFGVAQKLIPPQSQEAAAIWVLIIAIGISNWAGFARTVRGATMVERRKDYVAAAQLIGVSPLRILFYHILRNVLGPVLVIATIGFALAIIEEATLSYLGVGVPPTQPSLGTLIRIGQQYLFSGEWWILLFPALVLVTLALAVNLLGDWLRDALNPRLK